MGSSARVLAALRERGLLLQEDKTLPSVVGVITGEMLAGSWWGHPRAKEIYDVLKALGERRDVLEVKLIGGKVTFVLAALWPALLGVGQSGEPWQLTRLGPAAKQLLSELARSGELERSGSAVKELEMRLLARTEQRHTASGKHVLVLETWQRWAERHQVSASPLSESKRVLERAACSIGAPLTALPWHRSLASRRGQQR